MRAKPHNGHYDFGLARELAMLFSMGTVATYFVLNNASVVAASRARMGQWKTAEIQKNTTDWILTGLIIVGIAVVITIVSLILSEV